MLPSFSSLRFEDVLNQARIDAHKSAYDLLKYLDEISDWDTKNIFQVATAESLTAGLMFSTLVDIPIGGSYKYGCFGVYDTDAKRVFLGVDVDDVYTHKCAKQMSEGVLKNSNASIAIAVTGNAMPYQQIDNMKAAAQLGEVFISISCYNSDKTIVTKTTSHNFCKDEYICKLWYDTIKIESELSRISNVKNNPMFTSVIDGFNESIITSNVSNFIRNKTTEQAFKNAISFLKYQKDKNAIIIPSFIIKNVLPNNQLNNTMLIDSRKKVKSECFDTMCDNTDSKNPYVRERDYHAKGKKNLTKKNKK